MMLLKNYISSLLASSPITSIGVLLVLILAQGCSSINDVETKASTESSDIEALGKDITDMVDVASSTEGTAKNSVLVSNTTSKSGNQYLAQKSERLATVPAVVMEKYRQALALMKKPTGNNGNWQQAEKLFDQVLAEQPQLSSAYVNKAIIAMKRENNKQASKWLDSAITVNPINPYAYQFKAQLARIEGEFEQAESYYLKALDIWPNYPQAQVNLAILLELYRGRLLDARQYYLLYLEHNADDQQVQRWLAGVEIKIKRAGLTIPEETNDSLSSGKLTTKDGES